MLGAVAQYPDQLTAEMQVKFFRSRQAARPPLAGRRVGKNQVDI
jgi:hypothetical protein